MVCFAWGGFCWVESIYPGKISKKYIDEILRYLKLKYLHNQWNLCLNQLNNGQGPILGMKKTGATRERNQAWQCFEDLWCMGMNCSSDVTMTCQHLQQLTQRKRRIQCSKHPEWETRDKNELWMINPDSSHCWHAYASHSETSSNALYHPLTSCDTYASKRRCLMSVHVMVSQSLSEIWLSLESNVSSVW